MSKLKKKLIVVNEVNCTNAAFAAYVRIVTSKLYGCTMIGETCPVARMYASL